MSIRTFGTGQTTASTVALSAMLNRLRARNGRTITVAKVARRLSLRGTITAAEVVTLAGAHTDLYTLSSGNTLITLTDAGHTAARSRMTPRLAVR